MTLGTRSGSGKLVLEFYDLVVQIWGGAPATEPVSFGVMTAEEEQGRIQMVAPMARATVRFPNLNFWKIMDCSKYPDMVLAV